MTNYLTIREFVNQFPIEKTFIVFRIFDGYQFKVKQINDDTVILNTDVNLEISQDDDAYLVHESSLGLDYDMAMINEYAPSELNKPVVSLNYKKELRSRLHNEVTWLYGRILKEQFYPFNDDLTTVNYDKLIVESIYDYTFKSNREVESRIEVTKWYNYKGEVCEEKYQPKLYKGFEGMREARRRRANIIDGLKHDINQVTSTTEGGGIDVSGFIGSNAAFIGLYIDYGEFNFINSITNDTVNLFLNNELAPGLTARMYMISKLNFLIYEKDSNGDYKDDIYKGSLL